MREALLLIQIQIFFQFFNRYFPIDSMTVCLDLGAGSGHYAKALRHSVAKVVACDIATCRLKKLAHESDIHIVECDIQEIPFDNKFGFVMCNFVLEHVANPYRVIDELIRVLVTNGTFLLSFPSFTYRDVYGFKVLNETPSLNFEHLRSFSAEKGVHPWEEETLKLTRYLEDKSCKILEIRGINITYGLDSLTLSSMKQYLDILEIGSSNLYPWNLYGQQTIIFGQKIC